MPTKKAPARKTSKAPASKTSKAPASKTSKAPARKGSKALAPAKAGSGRAQTLEEYRGKRRFDATPEPEGEAKRGAKSKRGPTMSRARFVVQRHRARRLHYDFRLEVDGVLASWAVPKGPTLDPSTRSGAFHVEDHPIEYQDFEGVIPKGQYGAGDVIVWDRGTWEPAGTDDPARAIADGELHFDLYGEKLRGRFVLVRTKRTSAEREQWLLLHKHDDFAQEGWSPEDHPLSVKSGRTNDDVAKAPEAMWRSDLPAEEAEVRVKSELGPAVEGRGRSGRPKSKGSKRAVGRQKKGTSGTTHPSDRSWEPASAAELEALDDLGDNGEWEVQGRALKLTNLNKVLFPGRDDESPITKRDLVRHYTTIAPVILPYLVDRPVNMHRFPNGVAKAGFWHKEVPAYAPDWLVRWRNEDAQPGESEYYAVIDSPAALAWMANYAAIELHPWTSRVPDVQYPTWAYIDIDPGTKTKFEEVVLMARVYRSGLDHLGVTALPKLTGSRGLHIWIPIKAHYTFDETRSWVEKLSRAVGAALPELVSWTWQKSARKGLARLDFTQNARNKTLVAPYSVRASAGAPVSVPIGWDELDDPALRSDMYSIRSVGKRVAKKGDPFLELCGLEQELPDL